MYLSAPFSETLWTEQKRFQGSLRTTFLVSIHKYIWELKDIRLNVKTINKTDRKEGRLDNRKTFSNYFHPDEIFIYEWL